MNLSGLLLSVDPAWIAVADALIKATLLLALTAGIATLMRSRSAASRHAVWTVGLVAALVVPAVSVALPRWEVPIVTIANPESPVVRGPATDSAMAPALTRRPRETAAAAPATETPTALQVQQPEAAQPREIRWGLLLSAIWTAGALLVLSRLLLGLLAVEWISRRTARVTDAPWLALARSLASDLGIRTPLTFLRSESASMPMAWGVFRASVLMPHDVDSWPIERLRIVLLHELAHVKRRDCLTHALAQLACAIYWFNPLVWFAAKRVRAEREHACDDLVLATGTDGPDYADQLLEIARVMRGGRFPALVAGATLAMAHRTQLEGRLIAILDPSVPRAGASRARTALGSAVCVCVVLPFATMQPWAYERQSRNDVAASQTGSTSDAAVAVQTPAPAPAPQPQPDAESLAELRTVASEKLEGKPLGLLEGVLQGVVQGVSQGIAQGVAGGVAGGVRGGVAGGVSGGVAGGVQGGVKQAVKEGVKQGKADPRTIAALVAALKDADAEVQEAALVALTQLGSPEAFEPLVQALRHKSPDVRERAAMGLAQLEDPRAAAALTEALKDENASVREKAVFGLGQLGDASSGAALAQALKDSEPDVREQAAFALGQLGSKAHVDALTLALKDDSADVREQAVFALSQIGDARAVPALAALLKDPSPSVREQSAFALGQIGDKQAVSSLISALKDENAEVRHHAAFALGQIGDRSAVEALVIAIKDTNADVREQVAFALGQIGDPRAVDALTLALKDASAEVRRHAAIALGQLIR
jgi:HEAT repeat protein/beta-lactamase regulating signal transducer with metallopeptidase domain